MKTQTEYSVTISGFVTRELAERWASGFAFETTVNAVYSGPPEDTRGRIIAMVQPQFWEGDYARDAGEPVPFDVTDFITNDDWALEEHDRLYFEAVERGLAPAGFGPFEVYLPNLD